MAIENQYKLMKNGKAALQKTIIKQLAKQGGEVLNKHSNHHYPSHGFGLQIGRFVVFSTRL